MERGSAVEPTHPGRLTRCRGQPVSILEFMEQLASHDPSRYPDVCPHLIPRTPMRMRWEELTMLHWRYPAEEVQALLPEGLTVETFDGSAWVGLIPFQMRVDVPFFPALPRILHFPETNVRTYVSGRSGKPGVYFFSLEASALISVVTARTTYQVPYFWADMSIERTPAGGSTASVGIEGSPLAQPGDRLRYQSRRYWPKPKGASSLVEVEVGPRFEPDEVGDIDRFLTGRWALYGDLGPWITYATMFHEPWPLHRAQVTNWEDSLVVAAGFSEPSGEPLVHYSPGVSVRCGWPSRG